MQMTTALPAAASNEEDDEEEETCPVCYEPDNPAAAGDTPTSVACEVCKHAVCGECDTMLTQAGWNTIWGSPRDILGSPEMIDPSVGPDK